MEKQTNSSNIEVCKNKVTASRNMNSSSQFLNDTTKSNLKIDSTTSTNCSETILCSLLTNKNSSFMKCVSTNGGSHKTEKNGPMMIVENDNNNTVSLKTEANIDSSFKSDSSVTMSSWVSNTVPDAKKEVKNEIKNGFSEFSHKSLYDSSAFNDMKNCYQDDNTAKKEGNCMPIENDFRDILECSQFMRTGRKQYTNDAVNLDELNLSVSKILNSTKTNVEERKIVNESSMIDAPCSKTIVNKDHSYHLPLPLENGAVVEIDKRESAFDTDKQGKPAEKFCSTDLNSSSINKNDNENNSVTDASKNLHIAKSQNSTECILDIQTKKQSEHKASADNALIIEGSGNTTISSPPPLILSEGTSNDEKNLITTVKESKSGIIPTEIDDTHTEGKNVKNSAVSTEVLALERKGHVRTLPKVDSTVMSGEDEKPTLKNGENKKTQVDQSSDLKPVDVLESVENKAQNTSSEKTANKDLETEAASLEKFPFVAETSYDCKECGAKLKTQNSLFTHKKMHISGAIVMATAKKRKLEITEENERPQEVKRKRGRPKLVKTENSTETVTPLKENVAKKVLRNRAQSDELKRPKLKQSAKAVKENKISNIDKTPKSKRNLRVREPVLTKVISNKSEVTSRADTCNNTNKTTAKVESVKLKGKIRNCFSSSARTDLLRKFICPECGAKFKRNDHMKRHQLLHSEKSFQCCDCGMKFYRGDKLKLHTIRHHPVKASKKSKATLVVRAKLPKKSVECHKCGIQFLRIVPPKTDKSGQSRRKTSCCISCGAKMKDENN